MPIPDHITKSISKGITLCLLWLGPGLAQQVSDPLQVFPAPTEKNLQVLLQQHHQQWGRAIRLITAEGSPQQEFDRWKLSPIQKQHAVQVLYNPSRQKATVTVGKGVKFRPESTDALNEFFGAGQHQSGLKLLLQDLVSLNPMPAPLSNHLSDYAGVVQQDTARQLRDQLTLLETQTGLEGTVVTVPSLRPYGLALEPFAEQLFNSWGVGRVQQNDGFLVLLAVQERQVRIQLGKGYEGRFNEVASQVIRTEMLPRFKEGRFGLGLLEGTAALTEQLRSAAQQPAEEPLPNFALWTTLVVLLPLIFLLVGVIVLVVVFRALRPHLRSSRGGGGGMGGMGGRSGGSGSNDHDEVQRSMMAGAAAASIWSDSSSSSSNSDSGSSSSSSDSFSGGSTDSSSGSSDSW